MSILPISKQRKTGGGAKAGRFLITVTVLGSAGPIRFVVNEGELVAAVIDTALRSYAREGRRPVLGSDLRDFLFYCANAGSDVLNHWETISSSGSRNFVLCTKQQVALPSVAATEIGAMEMKKSPEEAVVLGRKGSGGGGIWKSWFNSLKISSH